MAQHGKLYLKRKDMVDHAKRYTMEEAIQLIKSMPETKFDETVDLAMRLGVNPKHSEQMVRGSVVLPEGTGKAVRVLVFTKSEKEREAKESGADYIGLDDLIEKIQAGWFEFDRVLATPDVMSKVAKLGKTLGTKGLMPSPKMGTVTFEIGQAVKDAKKGQVTFRVDKVGNLHIPVGKRSFNADALMNNLTSILDTVVRLKPPTAKGMYLKTVSLSLTMGPGIKIDPQNIMAHLK